MNTPSYEPFVIISACTKIQHWRSAIEDSCRLKAKLTELGIAFKVVSGMFEGKPETSYYIPGISITDALDLAKDFGQQSILVVDVYREAHLHYTNGQHRKYLGYFMVGESDDNYTIDQGIKYICTKA